MRDEQGDGGLSGVKLELGNGGLGQVRDEQGDGGLRTGQNRFVIYMIIGWHVAARHDTILVMAPTCLYQ